MSRTLRAYGITDNNVTVNFSDGQTHILPRTDPLAETLIQALREGRKDEIPELVSKAKRVEKYGQGNFKVQDGRILINGMPVPPVLSAKILKFQQDGLPVEPLIKFAENIQQNPSYRALNELYQFLEKNNHPITENGCFIAYKKVREDFKDAYTGTMDNSPGTVVEMPRNQVNENANETCSHGLHVANWDYAFNIYSAGSNANMLEVEVNPADVVAVPIDYNQAKMRVCKYKVLGVVDKAHSENLSLRVTESASTCCDDEDCGDPDEDDEEDEDSSECVSCDGEGCEDCCDEEEEEDYEEDEECDCDECEAERDEYPWDDELDE